MSDLADFTWIFKSFPQFGQIFAKIFEFDISPFYFPILCFSLLFSIFPRSGMQIQI